MVALPVRSCRLASATLASLLPAAAISSISSAVSGMPWLISAASTSPPRARRSASTSRGACGQLASLRARIVAVASSITGIEASAMARKASMSSVDGLGVASSRSVFTRSATWRRSSPPSLASLGELGEICGDAGRHGMFSSTNFTFRQLIPDALAQR